MVNPRWSFKPRRHVYLVGAAGLLAASGWLVFEPLPCATQSCTADASGAWDSRPDSTPPRARVNDAPAAVTIQHDITPWLLAVAAPAPAGGSAERRLPALVQAPKHGPPS